MRPGGRKNPYPFSWTSRIPAPIVMLASWERLSRTSSASSVRLADSCVLPSLRASDTNSLSDIAPTFPRASASLLSFFVSFLWDAKRLRSFPCPEIVDFSGVRVIKHLLGEWCLLKAAHSHRERSSYENAFSLRWHFILI